MKKLYFFFIAAFLSANFLIAQPTNQTFNASGTYSVPVGYTATVTIEAWGAGGGGTSFAGNGARGGGGGGAYAQLTTTLNSGNYAVTVGTGGIFGVSGTASSFTTICVAAGGSTNTTDANGGAGGTTAASTGTILHAGGSGANPAGNVGGGGGGSASSSADGNNGSGVTGGTGQASGGNGGPGGNNDGLPGGVPGGGGGGRAGPGNGGNSGTGGNGRVIVTVNSVLPVRLKSFTAVNRNNKVMLNWLSETEASLSGYTVERSTDGIHFTALTNVPAHNSVTSTAYDYTDAASAGNVLFYRIAINEIDGRATYSRIIKVLKDNSVKTLLVYPNPVRGDVVSFTSPELFKGKYEIKIFNTGAQLLYRMKYDHSGGTLSQQVQLPPSAKAGIYTLQLIGEGVSLQQSFMMQ